MSGAPHVAPQRETRDAIIVGSGIVGGWPDRLGTWPGRGRLRGRLQAPVPRFGPREMGAGGRGEMLPREDIYDKKTDARGVPQRRTNCSFSPVFSREA